MYGKHLPSIAPVISRITSIDAVTIWLRDSPVPSRKRPLQSLRLDGIRDKCMLYLVVHQEQKVPKEKMMKILLGVMMAMSIICITGGCAPHAITGRTEPIESSITLPPVGNFNDKMKNLADQLDKNVAANNTSNTYIVTSFTNLDKIDDTMALGRLISENLIYGLQVHKWQIIEIRLTKGVEVNAAGEFFLSRDISKLRDEYKISGVVTGTYSVADGNLTINARVIDVNNGLVTSSAQTYIPVHMLPETSSRNENGSKTMKIVSDGIK
jgi:TolB-like protein